MSRFPYTGRPRARMRCVGLQVAAARAVAGAHAWPAHRPGAGRHAVARFQRADVARRRSGRALVSDFEPAVLSASPGAWAHATDLRPLSGGTPERLHPRAGEPGGRPHPPYQTEGHPTGGCPGLHAASPTCCRTPSAAPRFSVWVDLPGVRYPNRQCPESDTGATWRRTPPEAAASDRRSAPPARSSTARGSGSRPSSRARSTRAR